MAGWDLTPYFNAVTEQCCTIFADAREHSISEIITPLLHTEGMPMHCPVHHYIVPAALLTACRRAQGHDSEVLRRDLAEAQKRAQNVLGGFCGFYGACGAAVGLGIFWSLITDSNPLSTATWAYANRATGQALLALAEIGGPRCCKRVSYMAIQSALPQIRAILHIDLAAPADMRCTFSAANRECLQQRCPYYSNAEVS